MDFTLLALTAAHPVSEAQVREALRRRSAVPIFQRYVKNGCRSQTKDVLPAFDPDTAWQRLLELAEDGLVEARSGATGPTTYVLSEEGHRKLFGWMEAFWI
jgi:hypothetical protein